MGYWNDMRDFGGLHFFIGLCTQGRFFREDGAVSTVRYVGILFHLYKKYSCISLVHKIICIGI